jgi:hypothetical protein
MKTTQFISALLVIGGLLPLQESAIYAAQPLNHGQTSHVTSDWLLAERQDRHEDFRQNQRPEVDPATGLRIVPGASWMVDDNIPWSEPVIIRAAPGSTYVAVLDRDFEEGPGADVRFPGVATQWSRTAIEVYGYGLIQNCFYFVCNTEHPVYPVSLVQLKVDDQVFQLQGKNNRFALGDTLLQALQAASPDGVLIRFAIAGSGNIVTRPIGAQTIAAWQTLEQDLPTATVSPGLPMGAAATVVTVTSQLPPHLPADLPVVEGSVWRRGGGLPWSEPVIIQDEFEGDYLAVLDHDYSIYGLSYEKGIITNWSRDRLQVLIYEGENAATSSYQTLEVASVELTLNQQVFHLKGRLNQFPLPEAVVQSLGSPPTTSPTISYRNADGDVVTHVIGEGTVNVWPLIYSDVQADH